ncbi:aminoglycoside phosphotransferase family protein [Streptomyces sp. CAI-121]|uniref:aminoglycoside phosphotransferase family protein n=1 Tax=unclassified Streptomyces TaxID=2593676 RepID=UPI0015872343|nr:MULTISPECIES: aminoglycoside phosphotransferase family protein [unclassified Streptomyces]NUV72546.1 aminoglycoside phosphotransferase family protein [Streptomyces sp. CAI-121]NUW18547.1 aminoglycoside phosphotransferase family protein [Streptomyces sp. CAI-68]
MWLRLPFGDELRAELGSPRRSRRLNSSPRSRVWRIELPEATAVVKQIVDAPDADERYAREIAALQLATRAEFPVVPALLGADPGQRVLVLEHLTHHPPASDWIIGYAAALARLHATTRPEDVGMLPQWQGPNRADAESFLRLAGALEVPVRPGVPGELEDLVNRLGQASGHALLHGDPCPGNDLHTATGIRFIDFEQASLGNGLMELAYLRIGFPTCWCVTSASEPLLDRAESAYRNEWRTLTGSEAQDGLADACAGWLLRGDALVERAHRGSTDHLARIPYRDWTWGTATARQRLVHRLGIVAQMTADHTSLSGMSSLSTAMRRRMLTRWPALQPVPAKRP